MDDLNDEIDALVAAARAWLHAQVGRGVRAEAMDAELPEPSAEDRVALVEAEPEEVVVDEPAAPAAAMWDQLAATSRATQRPIHHDDGSGAAGLAAIRADIGDCTRCGLCEGRKNIVFGVGDPEADLMVIGEGPGEQEDQTGEPFVGPAGQMLDLMLTKVLNLSRSQVYIANVVKCRPPGNRNPEHAEANICKPFLMRQIAAVQPRLILVLGSVALQELLDVRGIQRNRGQERKLGAIPVIPTFHPAYLLRTPEDKRLTFEDLKLARQRYDALGGKR